MKKIANKDGKGNYTEAKNGKSAKPDKSRNEIDLEKKWEELVKKSEKPQKPAVKNEISNDIPKYSKPIKKAAEKTQKKGGKIPPAPRNKKRVSKSAAAPSKEKPVKSADIFHEETKAKSGAGDYLETDVDKLYELAREKGIIKVKDAAKILKIDIDQIEEWGRILEEHKLVRLRYPPIGEPVIILKKFTADTEIIKSIKNRKELKPAKRVFIINLAILLCFAAVVSFYTIRFGAIRITYTQAYLAAGAIIIIAVTLIYLLKFRKKGAEENDESGRKQPEG